MLRIATAGSTVLSLVLLLTVPGQARDRRDDRPVYDLRDDGGNGGAGRNAGLAIADGLADLSGGWIATIGNAYADPYFREADYFDYYRRRTYGAVRSSRR